MIRSALIKGVFSLFCISSICAATQNAKPLEEILDLQDTGISSIAEEKVYLHPDRLYQNYQHEWIYKNDSSQCIPIRQLLTDQNGFYVYGARLTKCPQGHEGFVKEGGTWYCNVPACPFYWQKM